MERNVLVVSLFLLLPTPFAFAGQIPAIFTFGNSLFDAGNNHFNKNCSIQADFPPYGRNFFHHPTGRFTNGRTIADFISELVGLPIQEPYLEVELKIEMGSIKDYPKTGINFASAGSGLLQETSRDWGVTPIQTQFKQLENLVKQKKLDQSIIKNAFFLFESGSNDVFQYFIPAADEREPPQSFVARMLKEILTVINGVYALGARRIVALGLGPVGCIPARSLLPDAPVDKCYKEMNDVVTAFNQGLEHKVMEIPKKLPGAVGVFGDAFNMVQQFISSPRHYGFKNMSSACCGGGVLGGMVQCGKDGYQICQNPDEYLFWDFFHPTEHANNLLSKAFWSGKSSRIRPLNLKALTNTIVS
ncbi:GDSL esterase/lipase 6 [Amborella trichopoda]|nr:GDSL esterase/lipase 6 [Amborella trichopoda]|eukprot:XP_006837236.2 GDSL esterase/lipase 6 [Amborella trichopoda]